MALFPFRKRQDAAEASATPADQVQRARARARQRLIGAVVLLGVGIIGFPLLFETQPRPIPVDVKVDIPRKDAVPPLAMPTPPATGGTRSSGQVMPVAPEAAPATPAAAPAPAVVERPASPAAVAEPRPSTATPAAAPPPADAERARALLESRPVAVAPASPSSPPAPAAAAAPAAPAQAAAAAAPATAATPAKPVTPAAETRFVVQVGAFADRAAAQKTRERVEQLGLKTYTQVVETAGGPRTRVRIGPLASRDEADKVAAKLKAAGLPAAVLTL